MSAEPDGAPPARGAVKRVPPEVLRTLFLFEALEEEQLRWLSERSELRAFEAGAPVYQEGAPAEHLFVLLDGGVQLSRLLAGEDVVATSTEHRGAYAGATRAYVDEPDQRYTGSMTATRPSSFAVWTGDDFAAFMRRWMPMAIHLLDGLYLGVRTGEAVVRQREHLARLGTLSANLAHELNNPAAATARAASQLRTRVAGMRAKLGMVASGHLDGEVLARLVDLQERTVEAAAKQRGPLSPLEESDLEDALLDRLEELGVGGAHDVAPVLAAARLQPEWVDEVAAQLPGTAALEGALRWMSYTLETEALMDEIEDASARISALVGAVKQYSHMDQASQSEVDVHPGLDSTVVMLGHALGGVEVRREYGADLPRVPANAGELNQVWTNLIDNAAHAMGGRGVLVLRTRLDGEHLVVEVADDGPGIPDDVQPRVFEAFFTTKPPGQGSGLGLDGVRRIVERGHGGRVSFTTGPAGTTFAVRLPLSRPA